MALRLEVVGLRVRVESCCDELSDWATGKTDCCDGPDELRSSLARGNLLLINQQLRTGTDKGIPTV